MSKKVRTIQFLVLVLGLIAWAVAGATLKQGGKLEFRPNILQLKGSPYGRTLALAMRGPVDLYWHRGEIHDHDDENCAHCAECDSCGEAGAGVGAGGCDDPDCDHDHGAGDCDDPDCGHDHGDEPVADAGGEPVAGVRTGLLDLIVGMRTAYHSRNNERVEGKLHRAFILSETEKRLALSYHMDPTNLACYGSFFMFFDEALARVPGDRGEEELIRRRQQQAMELARYTLLYCLNHPDEAPAMVTGGTAAHDFLRFHFGAPEPDLEEIARLLQTLDFCIGRYEEIRAGMIEEGSWENFFVHRREEMENGYSLLSALRDADRATFERLSVGPVAAPAPAAPAAPEVE